MASSENSVSKLVGLLSDQSENPNLTIVDTILFHLGIADIYALHAVCRSLRWLVGYMTDSPRLLNINKQLGPFVKDTMRFRSELGKYDGLIAGDFVRNFFEFGRWEVTTLLLYVEQGLKSQGFIDYLRDHEGYETKSQQHRILERNNAPGFYIVMKATTGPPIINLINEAYTTAGLNVISWNKAYSLLPIPTIVRHKFYPIKPFDNALGQTLRQRAKWGWTTRDMLWPDQTTQFISQKQCRQIGGPSSLVIGLGNIPPGDFMPDYVLDGSVFSVVWDSRASTRCLSVSVQPAVESTALRYAYTNGGGGQAWRAWEKFLRDRLDRWVYVEIAKMGQEQRPPGFYFMAPGNYRVSIPSGYELPGTWDYADDQIISWFQEWDRDEGPNNTYYGH
ncbi:hypothetical protein LRP88_12814 [Fusarium phalaenopsidis]|nr:hypothetical protein NCS56_00950000 [Fusarium sp. Ph1]